MNQDELTALDRRAASAVAELDAAVADAPVPEWSPPDGATSRRRWLPAAVAASLVVVALVAAAVVAGTGGDERSTVAGQPDATGYSRLALPDPEALGFRVIGAFGGGGTAGTDPSTEIRVTVQVPSGADPEGADTVVEYALPANDTTLDGDPIDIGVQGAVLDQEGFALAVGWPEGATVRYLMSADLTAGELVATARDAVEAGAETGWPLPGFDVLHRGSAVDVFPTLTVGARSPGGWTGVAYESGEVGFAVATTAGSNERWLAARALARAEERIEVRGRPAVLAEFGDGLVEVSWLERDGTLARAGNLQGDIPLDVLDELEPISSDAFDELVEEFGADAPRVDQGSDSGGDDGTEIAAVETSLGEVTFGASVSEGSDGTFELRTSSEGPNGASGSGQPLTDLDTPVVAREVFVLDASDGGTTTLLVGLIGPGVQAPGVVDAATGEVLTDVIGPMTATLEGSDQVLFLTVMPPGFEDRDLAVVGTSATGEQVRLDSPAR